MAAPLVGGGVAAAGGNGCALAARCTQNLLARPLRLYERERRGVGVKVWGARGGGGGDVRAPRPTAGVGCVAPELVGLPLSGGAVAEGNAETVIAQPELFRNGVSPGMLGRSDGARVGRARRPVATVKHRDDGHHRQHRGHVAWTEWVD